MVRFGQPGVLVNQAWNTLLPTQQQSEARIMEVFAGMLSNLDDNVGQLIAYLKQIGEYDNTLIIFLSDNGADGMGYGFIPYVDSAGDTDIDDGFANYGKPGSFLFRSTRWAEVGTVPLRLPFKAVTARGRRRRCRPSSTCRGQTAPSASPRAPPWPRCSMWSPPSSPPPASPRRARCIRAARWRRRKANPCFRS